MSFYIQISSESLYNPSISEQKILVEVDGVTYEAVRNAGGSSTYYDKPRRKLMFIGFKPVGSENVGTQFQTPEELYALNERYIKATENGENVDLRYWTDPNYPSLNGSAIVVPRSMMDSIRVIFHDPPKS